jgi:hypothetical protein
LNGYSIISIAPDRKRAGVNFRTYFDARRSFGEGENIVSHGHFFPNQESREFWTNQPLRINLKKFRRWLAEHALTQNIAYYNECTVNRKLSDIFVCPPLVKIELRQKEVNIPEGPFIYTKVGYDKIFELDGNIRVYCPPEHGQTSFAKQTALNYILRSGELSTPRLPLIVDCAQLGKYDASLVGLLKAAAPDLVSLGKNLDVILDEGLAVVLFENIMSIDEDRHEVISRFMERLNRNRFILFIRSNFGESVDSLLDASFPNVTDVFHIQPFSRLLLREFIRKWDLKLRASEDVTLDQVITRFRELALPLTPFYLTLLFTVYERDSSFRPTNTASLVENFVEFVLGKSSGNLDRGAFDYRNRVSVLAYLAERMIKEDNFDATQVKIYGWVERGLILKRVFRGLFLNFLTPEFLHRPAMDFNLDMTCFYRILRRNE